MRSTKERGWSWQIWRIRTAACVARVQIQERPTLLLREFRGTVERGSLPLRRGSGPAWGSQFGWFWAYGMWLELEPIAVLSWPLLGQCCQDGEPTGRVERPHPSPAFRSSSLVPVGGAEQDGQMFRQHSSWKWVVCWPLWEELLPMTCLLLS